MIYFLTASHSATFIRRFARSLLAVPMVMLITACDNSSSTAQTTDNDAASEVTSVTSQQNSTLQDADNAELEAEVSDEEQGQSLIAAAKMDSSAPRSDTSTESDNSSGLQAVLMGDYGGMMPCSSCSNIDVTLNLFADATVKKTSTYINAKPAQASLIESGIYRQDNNMIIIVYEDKRIETYLIQDNHLVMMDENDNPSDDYTLSRK